MNKAFGGPFRIIDDTDLPAALRSDPQDYALWVKQQLSGLRMGEEGILRLRRPKPTAAFSPKDTTHPRYEHVKDLVRARGFVPIERGTGGRLTLFDEDALVLTIISPHSAPGEHMLRRYELLSSALTEALAGLGITAQVGELPDEYCPGKYSVNAEGRIKLIGLAQRMNQRCWQMGAIISVTSSEAALNGISEAYAAMGLSFNPRTYGAIRDLKPALTDDVVRNAIRVSVSAMLSQN